MIRVECLSKTFKKEIKKNGLKGSISSFFNPKIEEVYAVNNISFHVDKGEILGFIGPNGAGKSTTIKMMTGILNPSSGICEINNFVPYTQREEYVKDIGVVFGQRTQLWWDLPLNDTFKVLKEIYEENTSTYHKNIEFLNEILDISEFINQPVRTLSLGQRMRADIAAALLHNPKVLFLDEPTIGLDVIVKDKIRQAIKKINSEQNTTIVLTTHDMLDIESLADKIIMIDKGKLAFQGSIEKLRSMYGEGKIITFKLTDVSDFSKLIQSIETSGIEAKITREDRQVSILFDASKNSISSFIINLLQSVNVNDIMLSDIGIDEIVKKAYSREV